MALKAAALPNACKKTVLGGGRRRPPVRSQRPGRLELRVQAVLRLEDRPASYKASTARGRRSTSAAVPHQRHPRGPAAHRQGAGRRGLGQRAEEVRAPGSFDTILWDPTANTFKKIATPVDFFCSGHAQLPDGRLLVAGGTARYELLDGEVKKAGGGSAASRTRTPTKPSRP